jgi:hypothetical protein
MNFNRFCLARALRLLLGAEFDLARRCGGRGASAQAGMVAVGPVSWPFASI